MNSHALKIESGSRVCLHYKLIQLDGKVIDQTSKDEPLEFTVGDGTFPSGVEPLFIGLASGQKNRQTVEPENGWGHPDPDNVQYLKTSDFADSQMLSPGKVIEFRLPNDDALPGTIVAIEDEHVQVDFNPPLAGQNITVEVTIVSVQSPEETH